MNKIPEGKQGKTCHDAVPEHNTQMTVLLNDHDKKGNNIYVVREDIISMRLYLITGIPLKMETYVFSLVICVMENYHILVNLLK